MTIMDLNFRIVFFNLDGKKTAQYDFKLDTALSSTNLI